MSNSIIITNVYYGFTFDAPTLRHIKNSSKTITRILTNLFLCKGMVYINFSTSVAISKRGSFA